MGLPSIMLYAEEAFTTRKLVMVVAVYALDMAITGSVMAPMVELRHQRNLLTMLEKVSTVHG